MPSIFSRIIAREIPSYKIYEDEKIYAFLTIEPHTLGHTLVVPKEEIGNIMDIPDELTNHLINTAKNIIAPAIQKATKCIRVGWSIEGFGVPDHAHLHLIPLFGPSDINTTNAHGETPENMQAMCEKIVSFIA